ncbi:MAG TPA: hypothetical protein PKD72_14260 [Gemmatales bacterium]|nr:hypothetical protein [Gemmatales bacterium]
MLLFKLILKNVFRNKLRSILTTLAIFFLVTVLTLVGTVLRFLEDSMAEKERDIKLIITERSDMDSFSHRYMEDITRSDSQLNAILRTIPGFEADVYATWNFVAFSLDRKKVEKDSFLICVATQPEMMMRMTDGIEELKDAQQVIQYMKSPPISRIDNIGIVIGPERMKSLNKKLGDVFTAYLLEERQEDRTEYQFENVGVLPANSRWTTFCFMNI